MEFDPRHIEAYKVVGERIKFECVELGIVEGTVLSVEEDVVTGIKILIVQDDDGKKFQFQCLEEEDPDEDGEWRTFS